MNFLRSLRSLSNIQPTAKIPMTTSLIWGNLTSLTHAVPITGKKQFGNKYSKPQINSTNADSAVLLLRICPKETTQQMHSDECI